MAEPSPRPLGARRLGVCAAVVDGACVSGDVEVADGRVTRVGLPPSGSAVAVPGFVDLQVNGFAGVDLRTASPDDLRRLSIELAAHGAVAVQPTLCSTSIDGYRTALAALDDARSGSLPGCRLLSAHLEGPFLSTDWAGAHDPATLLPFDEEVLDVLLAAGEVGMITYAPELDGATELVARCIGRGVVPSIGHTDATAAQTRDAIDHGARHLTHCWNAHRRFAPRDPGPAGAALIDPRCTVGLIADLVHVERETVLMTLAAAPDRVAVTTDAVAAAGRADAAWSGGAARRGDGTLAGGLATPVDLLRNLVDIGCTLESAAVACSTAARRLLGLEPATLRPGEVADLVVLDDTLAVRSTYVDGVDVLDG